LQNKISLTVDLPVPLLQFLTSQSLVEPQCYVDWVHSIVLSLVLTMWLSLNPRASWFAADKGYYVQKVLPFLSAPLCTPPLPATRLIPTQTFPKFATIHFKGNMFVA
jgi:hypothetical protein